MTELHNIFNLMIFSWWIVVLFVGELFWKESIWGLGKLWACEWMETICIFLLLVETHVYKSNQKHFPFPIMMTYATVNETTKCL